MSALASLIKSCLQGVAGREGWEGSGLGRGEASAAGTPAKLLQNIVKLGRSCDGHCQLEMSLDARVASALCSSAIRVVLGLHGSPLWGPGVQQERRCCGDALVCSPWAWPSLCWNWLETLKSTGGGQGTRCEVTYSSM